MKKTRLLLILLALLAMVTLLASCGGKSGCDEHSYIDGVCTECGESDPDYVVPCEHVFANGGCTKCNKACICEFENGACKVCGKVCRCVFANGACSVCGKACNCNFENGACTVCGKACNCNFENGACTVCGKACQCVFVNGTCGICGKACNCNFENGACTVCLKACACEFKNGACVACGKACECDYADGTCTICGSRDSSFDGRQLYDEMIAKLKYLLSYKKANYELPEKEENPTVPNYDALYSVAGYYEPTSDLGYAYKDINGDGLVELFIIERDNRIYALFTIVDNAPVTVEAFQNGLGYMYKNEMIFYTIKVLDETDYQIKSEFHFTRLVGASLVGFAHGREDHDKDHDALTTDIFYKITEDGVRTEISKEEHNLYANYIYEYFTGYSTRLSKQSELVFNSLTGAMSDATVTADFSTYDAIINTFGLMYTEVADGKYVRSSFTSGKYIDGMIFKSDDDFILYNKLLAACVLSQNSTSATFGYAKHDLNGDGVEELILLEGTKYYVLAIFTEVNGKPVLLDAFNDLRVAFVDAEGYIHVYERILPGSKKDFEYFVYTVNSGKLAVVKAFGVKCDAAGKTQEAWYEIVDGEKIDIEKTAFEALLEEYFLVVGTVNAANCAKYTKENSGLEFKLAYISEE